jgi:hypothetical protein
VEQPRLLIPLVIRADYERRANVDKPFKDRVEQPSSYAEPSVVFADKQIVAEPIRFPLRIKRVLPFLKCAAERSDTFAAFIFGDECEPGALSGLCPVKQQTPGSEPSVSGDSMHLRDFASELSGTELEHFDLEYARLAGVRTGRL